MKFDLTKLVRENILNLKPYSSARDEFSGKSGIFLDANENPFGNLNRYPDPYQKTIKKKLNNLKNINTNQIFLGNGSDEVIDLAFRIFCKPGQDKVLTFSPTYGMYEVSAAINNVELITQNLDDNFQVNLEKLKPILDDKNLKIIFICSPNNPTGNCLENINYILENFEGIVFLDEAYIDFCPEKSFQNQLDQYPNLIISQTFSKAWGMAGARVGIAYASTEIIALYNKVKAPYNISQSNQNAVLQKLSEVDLYTKNIKTILEQKSWLIEELKAIDFVKKIYPSDANFLLIEVDNADEIYQKLSNQNIVIRNRNSVIKNCLRITVGSPKENKNLVDALKSI